MKIKLIINPEAGRKKTEKVIPAIKEILRDKKLDFDIDVTRRPGEAIHLSQNAAKNNFPIIVAIGGDGTVNEVVNGMIDSESALGVIPLGFGNDFAKGMGIPFKLQEACFALSDGVIKHIDIGKINNRYFVSGLGIGFDAWVAWESRKIRQFFPSRWVYLYTAIKGLFRCKPTLVNINLIDRRWDKKVLLVAVGNGRSCGGGFLLTPEAQFDDGLMDVCIVEGVSKLRLFIHFPKALKGTHIRLPYVTTLKTERLTIDSSSLLLAHADGEILEDRFYQIEILPRKLRVIIPNIQGRSPRYLAKDL